jgi:hypothetical protein
MLSLELGSILDPMACVRLAPAKETQVAVQVEEGDETERVEEKPAVEVEAQRPRTVRGIAVLELPATSAMWVMVI